MSFTANYIISFDLNKSDYQYLKYRARSSFRGGSLFVDFHAVFVGILFSWIFRKSRDFDRNVTFTSVLAVTRKSNVAGVKDVSIYILPCWCLFTFAVQYAVKTGKFTYNGITTMNFLTNFTITKFCLCLIIQKSSFCSQNSDVYICKRALYF
jgi:hypothetical protein